MNIPFRYEIWKRRNESLELISCFENAGRRLRDRLFELKIYAQTEKNASLFTWLGNSLLNSFAWILGAQWSKQANINSELWIKFYDVIWSMPYMPSIKSPPKGLRIFHCFLNLLRCLLTKLTTNKQSIKIELAYLSSIYQNAILSKFGMEINTDFSVITLCLFRIWEVWNPTGNAIGLMAHKEIIKAKYSEKNRIQCINNAAK